MEIIASGLKTSEQDHDSGSNTSSGTLDACGDADWTAPAVWRAHKTVDLACGSGTLLAATLTDMKRRAREQGADEDQLAALQKLAWRRPIKGLDINPVSLQLAASQLTAGNHNISYRQMGLHLMPYGPQPHDPGRVAVGTRGAYHPEVVQDGYPDRQNGSHPPTESLLVRRGGLRSVSAKRAVCGDQERAAVGR